MTDCKYTDLKACIWGGSDGIATSLQRRKSLCLCCQVNT